MLEVDALREPFTAAGRVCDMGTTHLLERRVLGAEGREVLDIVDAELTFVGASEHNMGFVQKLKGGLLCCGQELGHMSARLPVPCTDIQSFI
jgi:hypothetical protein